MSFENAHHFILQNPTFTESNIHNHVPVRRKTLSPIRDAPPSTSRNFTGQEQYLEKLHNYFDKNNTGRKMFLLYGMGGIGKTQISLKYKDEVSSHYTHIFWIDATADDTIDRSLKDVFKIYSADMPNVSYSSALVLHWISTLEKEWLIIFDNADSSPDIVEKYIPPGNKGNILITSRNPEHKRLVSPDNSVEIEVMKKETAIKLLMKACGLSEHSEENSDVAADIVALLYYLPLAIDQAGAYINTGKCNIKNYITIYNKYRSKLMTNKKFRGASKYNRTVYGTWEISFQKIEEMANNDEDEDMAMASKNAINLIYMCAFFHHDNISGEIFSRAAKYYADHVEDCSDSPLPSLLPLMDRSLLNSDTECGEYNDQLFMESIELLSSYSLIRINTSGYYSFHPLVQSWCKDRMPLDDQRKWIIIGRGIIIASSSHDEDEQEFNTYEHNLVPHIIRNISEGRRVKLTEYYDDVTTKFSNILKTNGYYHLAEDLRLEILTEYQQILGPDHRDTLNSMANLASVYLDTAKWFDAEQLLEQVVEKSSQILGKEDSATLRCMADLAAAYGYLNKWSEAEPLQVHVLEMRTKMFGPLHPKVLSVSANLAVTYFKQGMWAESEEMQCQIVEIGSHVFGSEHPNTLKFKSNLATTYWQQGKPEDAEILQENVMKARIRILGEDHPDTLTSMANLATTYQGRGKLDEAMKIQKHVFEMRTSILGAMHPHTLNIMTNIASTYRLQENWEDAESLGLHVLDLSIQVLGLEHPDTVRIMENLSETYKKQGKWQDAEGILVQALKIGMNTVGENHPDTLRGMASFCELLKIQEKWDVPEDDSAA